MNKKSKDLKNSSIKTIETISNSREYQEFDINRGFSNTSLLEPLPKYIHSGCERVFEGENNTYIILGRDRPSSRASGYGGRGDTQAGAIDIVTGLMGRHVAATDDENQELFVDKNFRDDASRIYLSQKSDIDRYLNLATGRVGNSTARASIAIKSDAVRIVGREGIKLVTKTDTHNSQGGKIDSVYGIDLIAGNNDEDLQPMLKGDNTVEALDRIVEHIKTLTGVVETLLGNQMKMNTVLTSHVHIGNLGYPTTPSIETAVAGVTTTISHVAQDMLQIPLYRTNLEMFKMNYLNPIGSKYINSRHNNTN